MGNSKIKKKLNNKSKKLNHLFKQTIESKFNQANKTYIFVKKKITSVLE